MNEIKDGGAAFPTGQSGSGMTLRDYFAAKALTLIRTDLDADWRATEAYRMADAMLEARK